MIGLTPVSPKAEDLKANCPATCRVGDCKPKGPGPKTPNKDEVVVPLDTSSTKSQPATTTGDCEDDPDFRIALYTDVGGYHHRVRFVCTDFRGQYCTGAASGLKDSESEKVSKACPRSCNICDKPWEAGPSPSTPTTNTTNTESTRDQIHRALGTNTECRDITRPTVGGYMCRDWVGFYCRRPGNGLGLGDTMKLLDDCPKTCGRCK
jgi:hypothetical protein